MNENQANWCLGLISDLYKWKLSVFFRTPFDPEEEGISESARIKKEMDLDTVKANLLDGKYVTVDAFLADLRLICDNVVTLFGPDTVMTYMAEEFRAYIDERAAFATMTPEQAWFVKLKDLQEKIANHIEKGKDLEPADSTEKINEKKKRKKR